MNEHHVYFNDRIHGVNKVTEPVLVDLMTSPSFKRLRLISQHGLPNRVNSGDTMFSRQEHSQGVMLLLQKFGASLTEQIAGLLHDINHKAFSHLYEWVIGQQYQADNPQDLQDKSLIHFIKNSELPEILSKHGYSIDTVADPHQHSLLEQPAPNLCADRIDYTLRELPQNDAQQILSGLTVHNNRFICKDIQTALFFGNTYLDLQQNHWGNDQSAARYQLFVCAIRQAITLGIIEDKDFQTNDLEVLNKIKSSNDKQINQILELISQDHIVLPQLNERVHVKFRRIDPEILHKGELVPVSHFNPEFAHRLKLEEQRCYQGILV